MTGIKKHDTVSLALRSDQSDGTDIMLHLAPVHPLCDKHEEICGRGRKTRQFLVQKSSPDPAALTRGALNRNPNELEDYSYDLNVP